MCSPASNRIPSIPFRRFCPGVPEQIKKITWHMLFVQLPTAHIYGLHASKSWDITSDTYHIYMKAGTVQTPQIAARQLCSPAFQSTCHARLALKKINQSSKRTNRFSTMAIAEVAERPATAQRPDVDGRFGRFGGKYVRSRYPKVLTTTFECCNHAHSEQLPRVLSHTSPVYSARKPHFEPRLCCAQVPETLIGALKELEEEYAKAMADPGFQVRSHACLVRASTARRG